MLEILENRISKWKGNSLHSWSYYGVVCLKPIYCNGFHN